MNEIQKGENNMFSFMVDMKTIQSIEEFLDSNDCEFVQNMTEAGLDISAMAFVIQSIENGIKEAKEKLNQGE